MKKKPFKVTLLNIFARLFKKKPESHTRYYPKQLDVSAISKQAVCVLDKLNEKGFEAYLVGGGVRDLLLGKKPKDFDISTNARPRQIQKLFKRARIIGRRFQIVHVYFRDEIIEVATFRGSKKGRKKTQVQTREGLILKDNTYGTLKEDIYRRDFTCNALYYDIRDQSVIDYNQGLEDIQNKVLRIIGEPEKRYREDPMRMLRAVRLSAKLAFTIEPETEKPLFELGDLIYQIPPARILDELFKIYRCGHARVAFSLLEKYHLLDKIFPIFTQKNYKPLFSQIKKMTAQAMANADQRIAEGKTLSVSFFFATLLWIPLKTLWDKKKQKHKSELFALKLAIEEVFSENLGHLHLPKKIKLTIRETWALQFSLELKKKRQIYHTFKHPCFRNAYHLLTLRENMGEPVKHTALWWTHFQTADKPTQAKMIEQK